MAVGILYKVVKNSNGVFIPRQNHDDNDANPNPKYDITKSFTTRTASAGCPSSPTAKKISVATIHLISKGEKKRRHHRKKNQSMNYLTQMCSIEKILPQGSV